MLNHADEPLRYQLINRPWRFVAEAQNKAGNCSRLVRHWKRIAPRILTNGVSVRAAKNPSKFLAPETENFHALCDRETVAMRCFPVRLIPLTIVIDISGTRLELHVTGHAQESRESRNDVGSLQSGAAQRVAIQNDRSGWIEPARRSSQRTLSRRARLRHVVRWQRFGNI